MLIAGNEFLDYPRAICCDEDGTIFIMESRLPFVFKVQINYDNLLVALQQQQLQQSPPKTTTSPNQKCGESFECSSLPSWPESQCFCNKVEYCGISVERLVLSSHPIPNPSSASTTPRATRVAQQQQTPNSARTLQATFGASTSSSFSALSRLEQAFGPKTAVSAEAHPLSTAPELHFPMDICCSPIGKDLYLCDNRANRIHVYNYNGTVNRCTYSFCYSAIKCVLK